MPAAPTATLVTEVSIDGDPFCPRLPKVTEVLNMPLTMDSTTYPCESSIRQAQNRVKTTTAVCHVRYTAKKRVN